jgi:hypothetical protein
MTRNLLLGAALLGALWAGGCKQPASTGKGGASAQAAKTAEKLPEFLPVLRASRKYQDVDDGVKQAWYLVETSYLVVSDKWKSMEALMQSKDPATLKKGAQMKEAVTKEIQTNLFGTNPQVEKLFEDAIAEHPDNPLDLVSYAVYLLPRKTYAADGKNYTEQYDRALGLMDQAIKLWPDEASFYLVKISMLTNTLKVHEWTRNLSLEEVQIRAKLPEIRQLFDQAEKYDPDNHMINYWHAQLVARLTPTDQFAKVKDEVLDQIHKGDAKPVGNFTYPPPADPWPEEAHYVVLRADSTQALDYDVWMNYGYYDRAGMLAIYSGLLPLLHWPQDKQQVADLMFMLYNMGRTRPFDTSYFSWQEKILTTLMADPGIGQADKTQLAVANFMLQDYYNSAGKAMSTVPYITDPTKFNVEGLSEFETSHTREPRQKAVLQPFHASYLHEVADKLGLPPFALDVEPKHWGD